MVGGRLSYYGSPLEAAKFWKNLGADIVMLKPHKYEDFFVNDFSQVNSKHKKIIEKIKSMGLEILLHPEHIKTPEFVIEPSDPSQHKRLTRALMTLADLIGEFDIYPEICFGPPAFAYSPYKIMGREEISENEALSNSILFFRQFAEIARAKKIQVSLETIFDPGRNPNEDGPPHKFLCYKPEHFQKLIDNEQDIYTICVDTGHVRLSETAMSDYLALPYQITTLHLHSNDGQEDEHKLLTVTNAPAGTEQLLERSQGPKILELKNKETLNELRLSIESIRQNKLPNL